MLLPIIKLPSIRLATANLKLSSLPELSGHKQKDTWTFEGLVYITPSDDDRVVLPYADCVVWIDVSDYQSAPYRLWTIFHSTNYKIPKKPTPKTIKFLGKDMDITPPPPRESSTVNCADTEVIVDGPGSAFLVASAYVIREAGSIPKGDISMKIVITPSRSERNIVIERKLSLQPSAIGAFSRHSHEWAG
jgi:hypothetical protein